MDVEEFVRRQMDECICNDDIAEKLASHIQRIKDIPPAYADSFARAVIREVENTRGLSGIFLHLNGPV